jgi:sirohydrochlorin cobaltochelatase
VVPLMVSTNGSHVRQIEYYAGVRSSLPSELASAHEGHGAMVRPSVPVTVTRAIDSADELGTIMADRWSALPAADRARPLVLIAHGPSAESDVAPWVDGIRHATRPLAAALGRQPLHIGLLRDDAPAPVRAGAIRTLRDSIASLAGADSVVVMTVLISSGSIDRVKIPKDLGGLPVRYVGVSLAPHAALARWVERVARTSAAGPFNDTRRSAHTHH